MDPYLIYLDRSSSSMPPSAPVVSVACCPISGIPSKPSLAMPAPSSVVCVFLKPGIEGMAGIDGIDIFGIEGIAGMDGIDGALLNHPPTLDETPENTPPALALKI